MSSTLTHKVISLVIKLFRVTWVAQSVRCMPLAQVMISGSWDQVPCWAPCSAGTLLLPLLLLILLLLLFLSNKQNLKKKKIYLTESVCAHGREEAEGEVESLSRLYIEHRARCGAGSHDPEIMI